VELCARSIKPLERGRPWLRRTRALWRLNGRRQRCGDGEEEICSEKRRKARSTPRRAKDSSSRASFHAAAVTSGGERSWTSAGVSLSMTTIGPPPAVTPLSVVASPEDSVLPTGDVWRDAGRWWFLSDFDGLTGSEWCTDRRRPRADLTGFWEVEIATGRFTHRQRANRLCGLMSAFCPTGQ
jgi:hypothetical protein